MARRTPRRRAAGGGGRGPLNAERRNRLPDSAFAYPSRRAYPIDTLPRARNALARAAQSGTFGTYAHVARAVRAKWGDRVLSVSRRYGRTSQPGKSAAGQRRRRQTKAARRRR